MKKLFNFIKNKKDDDTKGDEEIKHQDDIIDMAAD